MTWFLAPWTIHSIRSITSTYMMFERVFWSQCRISNFVTKWTYSISSSKWHWTTTNSTCFHFFNSISISFI